MSDETLSQDELAAEKDAQRGLRPGQKSAAFFPSAKRLLREMRPERGLLLLAFLLGIIGVVLSVVGPKVLGIATDIIFTGVISKRIPADMTQEELIAHLQEQGQTNFADMLTGMHLAPGQGVDFPALWTVLGIVTGLYVLASLFTWLQGRILMRIVLRVVFRLRRKVEEKIHTLPLSYFDQVKRGDLLSRVTNDIDNIQNTLINSTISLVTSILTVIGTLAMMLWISPVLTAWAMVILPLGLLVMGVIGPRSQKLFGTQWDATGRVNAEVEEAFSGHEVITVFGRSREVAKKFERENEAMYSASFGAQFVSSLIMPLMMFAGNLSYVAVAVAGGLKVVSGQLTLGDVQAFIQYSRQFTQPLSQITSMATVLQSGVASAERVFQLLDAEDQSPDVPTPASSSQARSGRVEFEHVRFSYAPDRELITDLSLVAEPGSTIAIVGPTGAGKTTLVNLLMRFYEIDGGAIRLDGVDIRRLPRSELRSRTAMVLQDTWLFKGTVMENIRYGRLDASDEEVIAAAKAARADEFITQMADGYDTVLDDEGSSVSAGEKQLLTIARAFLAEPELLILDEATSSVDTRTEVLVQEAMSRLRKGRTAFVIAHRLSTIRDADTILVMEHGDIVEQGSHAELMAAGGAYARLQASQAHAATAAADSEPEDPTQPSPQLFA